MPMSNTYITIIESTVGIYGSWMLLKYHLGVGVVAAGKEKRRRERVEKYGMLILMLSGSIFCLSALLLFFTLL